MRVDVPGPLVERSQFDTGGAVCDFLTQALPAGIDDDSQREIAAPRLFQCLLELTCTSDLLDQTTTLPAIDATFIAQLLQEFSMVASSVVGDDPIAFLPKVSVPKAENEPFFRRSEGPVVAETWIRARVVYRATVGREMPCGYINPGSLDEIHDSFSARRY